MKSKKPLTIKIFKEVKGDFAENKDIARIIREEKILPALKKGRKVILDYSKVSDTTQSFTHAVISEPIRIYGDDFFDMISFKDCNESVKRIISLVAEYMQKKSE
jgi:hypothetical protein